MRDESSDLQMMMSQFMWDGDGHFARCVRKMDSEFDQKKAPPTLMYVEKKTVSKKKGNLPTGVIISF